MSDIKINNITDRSGSSGPVFAGISTVSTSAFMVMPSGPTEHRGGRGRGFFHGGRNNPNHYSDMNFINIASTGNASDFGDMSRKRNGSGGNVSSSTRALVAGGYDLDATANTTSIDYFIMSSSGGGNDFGDLIEASNGFGGVSNDTRGIYGGAYPSYSGVLSSVIIASTGSASSFGSLISTSVASGGINSPTRGIFSGLEVSPVLGGSGSAVARTEFVTITSTAIRITYNLKCLL